MATDGESLHLNCKKMKIVLKHFAKQFTNTYLPLLQSVTHIVLGQQMRIATLCRRYCFIKRKKEEMA